MNKLPDLKGQLDSLQDKLDAVKAHEEREQVFALEANERFARNIVTFEKYYPQIFKAINEYQTREGFCIHVTKSGHGNFIPKEQNVAIYGDDPVLQTAEQVKRYTESANFGRTDYTSTQEWQSDDPRLHIQYMRRLSAVLSKVGAQNYTPTKSLPKHYPTAMIFGIGLGYHIPELLSNHSFDYMFICEPDFELFFASLFCTNWFEIIELFDKQGACLFLSLGVNYEEFFDEIFRIAGEIGSFCAINSFCYQHYPSKEVNELIRAFFDNYYQLQSGYGFYNDAITGLAHAIHNVENDSQFLFTANGTLKELVDVPAFVIGNGPSLDSAIELIKKYQGNAIVFASGTALQSLVKAGITPDFHVLVERTKATYDVLKLVEPKEGYKDLNLLTVDVMYPEVSKLYNWAGVGLKGPEAATAFLSLYSLLKCGKQIAELPASGPFVSNTAFSYAVSLGFKQVYLFGVDNGYSLSGKTHSDLSIYKERNLPVRSGANIPFEGNLTEGVMATPLMAMSKTSFERLIRAVKGKIEVYNVGEGARLTGAIPLHENNVFLNETFIDKRALVNKIKSHYFESVASDEIEVVLGFDEFDSLCNYIIEIGNRPITTRDQANANLLAQQRVVFAYKKSKTPHFLQLLKGTMLYFHCVIVSFLYQFEEEEEILQHFIAAHDLWLEFVEAAKKDYRENWKTLCEHTKPEYQKKS
ncbi:DUF115 domain-containing protein [Pseudoalteromonas shioyasakiensis]|uniref:motility associated factor glycosyltransferase family protein n=1 Tax=Pseudoalteromonas shioyasakiensis TaxID=1190813 RepID=UPI0021190EAE|nr:6-hydroxymethylpterin diphosphokinase MptE-like protein [Pseudoalteromonas shioyasakiensis]MCQ8877377.1 DUF115 domain-containing protein [Pseudoalteromonas shioyasakiensis]